jgi:mannose-1-phosphate guanylyltransferase
MLFERDPEAIIATAPSDHVVNNTEVYIQAYQTAYQVMDKTKGKLLTIGIKPDRPHTGLGYIKMGRMVEEVGMEKVFEIDEFKEKPDQKTALEYLRSWQYMWNSACYFWRAEDMLGWLQVARPEMMQGIAEIMELMDVVGNWPKIRQIYRQFVNEQIEYAVVEGMKDVLVLPADLGWSDVGTWSTLQEMLAAKYETQVVAKGNHWDYKSRDILVYGGEKLVVTLGLEEVVVVDTTDVLLVMSKGKSEEIKKMLEEMKKDGKGSYL